MPFYNLLTEKLISVRYENGNKESLTLPSVLAKLSTADIESFSALQAHQEQAWYCFLVQLSAMAMHESVLIPGPSPTGRREKTECKIAGDEAEWTKRLRSLTPQKEYPNDEPWCMVVEDLSKPAFMQTPVPEGNLNDYKKEAIIPDRIDILNTAKNHDVKAERLNKPSIENWMFSLLTRQTMIGYFGSGHYSIARMRHVYASRPAMTVAKNDSFSECFKRDLHVLLNSRAKIVLDIGYPVINGKALLWLYAWDGMAQFVLPDLDPYFIEISRRMRMIKKSSITCLICTTDKERISCTTVGTGKKTKMITGDPWVPIDTKETTVFDLPSQGFSYKKIQEIMFGNVYHKPACLEFQKSETGDMLFIGMGMIREQAETAGLHERKIPIPGNISFLLDTEDGKQKLGTVSLTMVNDVATFTKSVYRYAMYALFQPKNEKPDYSTEDSKKKWDKWAKRLDAKIDHIFFERLWEYAQLEYDDVRKKWLEELRKIGTDLLVQAFDSVPLPSVRKYKVISAAEGRFSGAFLNAFDFMKSQSIGGVHV